MADEIPVESAAEEITPVAEETTETPVESKAPEQTKDEIAEAAFEWLQNEHEDANNYEQVIVTLMEEVPPGNMSAKKYLETLYIIAKGREGKAASSKKLAQKITRNSTDPDVKLSGKTRSSDVPVKSTKGMSIDDALSEAIAAIKV